MRTSLCLVAFVALAIPAMAEDQTVPCQVVATQKPCPADPQAEARWARKRLRELDEQAETARLNRQSNRAAAPAPLPVSAPPPAPAPRQVASTPPPVATAQYHSALEEYQALREAYDRQLRAYYRAFPAQARTKLPASNTAPTQAEHASQDAARAEVWHGYDRRDGNGY